MTKIQFIFLSALLLIFCAFSGFQTIALSTQVMWSAFFIILFGIPHGAIDHIISQEESNIKPLHFYLFYFGVMGLYIIFWVFSPLWSFILFLILSAFHFGQSQFSDLSVQRPYITFLLQFAWGISIISGLIFYNIEDIRIFTESSQDVSQLSPAYNYQVSRLSLLITTGLALVALFFLKFRGYLSTERLLSELYILLLIHAGFYLLPLVVGFTLYFSILHSLKVLVEEYTYLKERRISMSVMEFILLLLPYTFISVLGCIAILLFSNYGILNISEILLIFVLISVLTLPHSIVMSDFYRKLYKV